jgi:hypothetical protein
MFVKREQELIRLQEQLDRERQLLDRARKLEEPPIEQAPKSFCMTDLYTTIPGNDTASFRIAAYRT